MTTAEAAATAARALAWSGAESSARGQRRVVVAAAMATYLRTAMGRAGERLAPNATTETKADIPQSAQRSNHDDELPELKNAEAVGSCETSSSSGVTEEPVENQVEENDAGGGGEEIREEELSQFQVNFERPSTAALHDCVEGEAKTRAERSVRRWAFCDVLLRPDAHGLGLHLQLVPTPRGLLRSASSSSASSAWVISVASFRRLDVDDTGPAEACGQIRAGDVLHSVDGEPVATLEDVAARTRTRRKTALVLLRFLRRVGASSRAVNEPALDAEPVQSTPPPVVDASDLLASRPDVARLLRELVVRNQSLEEQLLASRLKQDEQRIQLEQLHALYAKTQLETRPSTLLSLPKAAALRAPFSRRASSFSRRASSSTSPTQETTAGAPLRGSSALSSAAARLMGVHASQFDVEFAVAAERERLTRLYEQRIERERQEMEETHQTQVAVMHTMAEKKMRMLELGVSALLATTAKDDAPSPHVQILRHQLLHRRRINEDEDGGAAAHADCVVCVLSRACASVDRDRTRLDDAWRLDVVRLLDEYRKEQAERERRLVETTATTTTTSSNEQRASGDTSEFSSHQSGGDSSP